MSRGARRNWVVVDEPVIIGKIEPGDTFGLQYIVRCRYVSGEPFLDPESEEAKRNDNGQNTYEPDWLEKGYGGSDHFASGGEKYLRNG